MNTERIEKLLAELLALETAGISSADTEQRLCDAVGAGNSALIHNGKIAVEIFSAILPDKTLRWVKITGELGVLRHERVYEHKFGKRNFANFAPNTTQENRDAARVASKVVRKIRTGGEV